MLHNLQKLSKTTCGQNVPSSLPFGLSLSQQTADGLLLRIGSRPSARQGWNILITQYNPKLLAGITYKRQSTLVQPQCMISSYGYHQHSVTCSTSTIFLRYVYYLLHNFCCTTALFSWLHPFYVSTMFGFARYWYCMHSSEICSFWNSHSWYSWQMSKKYPSLIWEMVMNYQQTKSWSDMEIR